MSSDAKKTEPVAGASVDGNASKLIGRNRWKIFFGVLAIGCLWWLVLSSLVVTTANPVTLNRRQILAADWIVVATLEDVPTGKFSLSETIVGAKLPATFVVPELVKAGRQAGESLLLPLSRSASQSGNSQTESAETTDASYSLTPNPVQPGQPLLYPASDDALSQLDTILGNSNRRIAE